MSQEQHSSWNGTSLVLFEPSTRTGRFGHSQTSLRRAIVLLMPKIRKFLSVFSTRPLAPPGDAMHKRLLPPEL